MATYLKLSFFLQISTGTEANCLFTSVLKCLNTGLPNYGPIDLCLQLINHMAHYLRNILCKFITILNFSFVPFFLNI